MATPTPDELEAMTPMIRQYYTIKGQAKDAIVFFRMGDFYEIFGDDAVKVAPLLELVLTSRERGDKNKIPFCGAPHHAAKNYWLKLLKLGYKVAIADQVEDPKEAKGLVRREITQFFTPGTICDLDGLDQQMPNYLLGICEDPKNRKWAAVVLEVSTGEIRCGNFSGMEQLAELVGRFRPKELLARRFHHDDLKKTINSHIKEYNTNLEELPEAPLRNELLQTELFEPIFGNGGLSSHPCGEVEGGKALISAALHYLKNLKQETSQFHSIRPLNEAQTMNLDEVARRDLEIFETTRSRQQEGSLFKEINCSLTPMGSRLLRSYLAQPCLSHEVITKRQDAVAVLIKDADDLSELRSYLKHITDLERIATRVANRVVNPRELAQINNSLDHVMRITSLLKSKYKDKSPLIAGQIDALSRYKSVQSFLSKAILDQPNKLGNGNEVFCRGYNTALDEINDLATNGSNKVAEYEAKLRKETGISSLKIKSHKTFGLLIEVTKSNLDKVPDDFIRRQTMVNNERFLTEELVELNELLNTAKERAITYELELYYNLLSQLTKYAVDLQHVAAAAGVIDVLQGFAWKAYKTSYCRPKTVTTSRLKIQGSRHPVVERFVGRHQFTPNDININSEKSHLLITGPNMAGKSTIMRQLALTAILHQIGSYVPASQAELPIFDRVFTRVGASDDLSKGQSTFLVEMSEAAQILKHATSQSLVILDEIGRGTSTEDGLALALAILEELVTNVKCFSLFATHYHELLPLTSELSGVRNVCTEVIEEGQSIKFTHRLVDGACSNSFGIEVAKIAGVPPKIIKRAQSIMKQRKQATASEPVISADKPMFIEPLSSSGRQDPAQYEALIEWSKQIKNIKIHKTTPIQALNILDKIRSDLTSGNQPELFS